MHKEFDTISVSAPAEHVLLVTLDRPQRGNAMNTQMGLDLRQLFMDIYVDAADTRCIIVTGRGEKIFCAGGDLKDRDGMTNAEWQHQHAIFEQMFRALRDCPVPVIGAINGAAYAGGCEFALGCDFLYAAEHAKFAITEVTIGIMPGAGGTINLADAIGERRAREVIYSGKPFTAQQAKDWGLVNEITAADELIEAVVASATRIAGNAPLSIKQVKKSISVSRQVDKHNAYLYELEAYNRLVPTEDRVEGVRAFNEKRKPVFLGK
ncbi:MAG: enoyl-CoA hydratase/isomerase family protein [Gammaproteobacteria bacterium]